MDRILLAVSVWQRHKANKTEVNRNIWEYNNTHTTKTPSGRPHLTTNFKGTRQGLQNPTNIGLILLPDPVWQLHKANKNRILWEFMQKYISAHTTRTPSQRPHLSTNLVSETLPTKYVRQVRLTLDVGRWIFADS